MIKRKTKKTPVMKARIKAGFKGGQERHGMSGTITYRSWASMLAACYEPSSMFYETIGEKGITVCDEWLKSFSKFYEDMGERPSQRHHLARIDFTKGYMPSNVEWRESENKANKYARRGELYLLERIFEDDNEIAF